VTIKAGNREPLDRDKVIIVIGEPSSGTRLIRRLIDASPDLDAIHDSYHGRRVWKSGRVVLVTRDAEARNASVEARWPGGIEEFEFPTLAELKKDYPNAPVISYDDVVESSEAVIKMLSVYYMIPVWEFDEEVYDANSEEGTRETYENAVARKKMLLKKDGKL